MQTSDIKCLKELESENAKLKKMYVDMALENHILMDIITKSSKARQQKRCYVIYHTRVWV